MDKKKHNWLDIANAVLLPIVVAASIGSLGINASNSNKLSHIINNHTNTLSTIESNQYNNSKALEGFIRDGLVCTFTLPQGTAVPTRGVITAEVDNCFPNTTPLK